MDKAIVITSIFPPTAAVRRFAELDGWNVIVAGDKKTPANWSATGTTLISAADQAAMPFETVKHLPFNHYCRKLCAYLFAMSKGAGVIYDSDDDNLAKADWYLPDFEGKFEVSGKNLGFVNIYDSFSDDRIWPRGFPLNLILDPRASLRGCDLSVAQCQVGVWQGLADDDPDVDAIYRLVIGKPCFFTNRDPIVLAPGSYCPFNSQNTFFCRAAFALLYLPAFVTFRFTDILRGIVAQPILHAAGLSLGFMKATVVQERNPHDYVKDFESEIPCYLQVERALEAVQRSVSPNRSISDNLAIAYRELAKECIVTDDELKMLDAWLSDVDRIGDPRTAKQAVV